MLSQYARDMFCLFACNGDVLINDMFGGDVKEFVHCYNAAPKSKINSPCEIDCL
jgi:hypothetical protein